MCKYTFLYNIFEILLYKIDKYIYICSMKNKLSVKKYEDGMYSLSSKSKINATINDAWSFFIKPKNLSRLSPENVKFKIISGKSDSFYEGKIISYKIKILPFIYINWTTEITKIIEKPKMTRSERKLLHSYLKKDIDKIESLLGVDLSHWKIID